MSISFKTITVNGGGNSGGGDSVIVKAPGELQGTPIPLTGGYFDSIYLNINTSPEEVLSLIDNLFMSLAGCTPADLGEFQLPLFMNEDDSIGCYFAYMEGLYIIVVANMNDIEDQGFFSIYKFVYSHDASINASIGSEIGFIGWNPILQNTNGEVVINATMIDMNDTNGPEFVTLMAVVVSELAPIISSAPLISGPGEDIILSGEYDGSTVVLNELPKGKTTEGTPVPASGYVDTIYLNTYLSPEEVVAICDTLTFVDGTGAGVSGWDVWSCVTDSTLANGFMVSRNKGDYANGITTYVITVSKNNDPIQLFVGGSGNGVSFWLQNQPIELNFNMDNQISVVGPALGLTPENEKASKLFSITPFEKVGEDNIIDLQSYIDEQKLPLKFKINKDYTLTSGDIDISANGEYDVNSYKKAIVNVSVPEGYIKPSGQLDITSTNVYDVTQYAQVQIKDANLKPENIPVGKTILGIAGTYEKDTTVEDALVIGVFSSYSNDRITYFRSSVFSYNEHLETISLPNVEHAYAYANFKACTNLKNVYLPKLKNGIYEFFRQCESLVEITLPSLENLGYYMFVDCISLETVILPVCSDMSGAQSCFSGCTNFKNLWLGANIVVPFQPMMFWGRSNVNVHVRSECVELYENDVNWQTLINDGTVVIVGDYTD